MGRRGAFESFLRAAARSAAASQRERQRALRAQATNTQQIERAERMARSQQARLMERQDREADKQAKQQYLADREAEAKDLSGDLQLRLADLAGLLTHTLSVDDRLSFQS